MTLLVTKIPLHSNSNITVSQEDSLEGSDSPEESILKTLCVEASSEEDIPMDSNISSEGSTPNIRSVLEEIRGCGLIFDGMYNISVEVLRLDSKQPKGIDLMPSLHLSPGFLHFSLPPQGART